MIKITAEHAARIRSYSNGLAVATMAKLQNRPAEDILLEEGWGHDKIAKAVVTPTMRDDYPAASRMQFLPSIAPGSAAVRLASLCVPLDLDGISYVVVPNAALTPQPVFVREGAPFPMIMGTTEVVTIGPVCKMLAGVAVASELEFANGETTSKLLGRAIENGISISYDAKVFDNVAGDDDRPPGLLFGVTPGVASAATGLIAIAEDLRTLASGIAASGGNADRLVIVAAVPQAITLRLLAGPKFDYAIIGASGLADGTIIAVDPQGVGFGASGQPTIEISKEGTVHFESVTPLPISATGSPNTVSAPVRSAFQSDLIFVRIRANVCHGQLRGGMVQTIAGVNW